MGHFENRTYVVVDIAGISNVNFSDVLETSAETIRKSIDESKFVLKYEHEVPQSITDLDNSGYLITINGNKYHTHSEILDILSTTEWTTPMEHIL